MRFLGKLFLGAALLALPAFGADLPRKDPVVIAPPPAMFNWSGFYVGADLGYLWGSAVSTIGPFGKTTLTANTSPGDWLYGGHVGAQKQFSNNLVLGAQVTVMGLSASDTVPVSGAPGLKATKTDKISTLGFAEAKIGYALYNVPYVNNLLPYLTVGGACDRANMTLTSGGGSITSNKYDKCGWTIGAGVDTMMYHTGYGDLIVGLKYNYADLGKANASFPVFGGVGISVPVKQSINTFLLDASLKY